MPERNLEYDDVEKYLLLKIYELSTVNMVVTQNNYFGFYFFGKRQIIC